MQRAANDILAREDFGLYDNIGERRILVASPEIHFTNGAVEGRQRYLPIICVDRKINASRPDAAIQSFKNQPLVMFEDIPLHRLYLRYQYSFLYLFPPE